MNNSKNLKIKRYAFYTLGVGLLLLGATNAATPSQRQMVKTPSETTDSKPTSMTAVENSKQNAEEVKAHNQTVKALSPKSQSTFHALPKSDQKRVVKAQQKNGTGHQEIHKILNEDAAAQKSASNSGMSPAEKSMSKSGMNNG